MSITKHRIFIDNCAWDYFFEHNISLATELPGEEFEILMTKEVYDFEVDAARSKKPDLVEYIQRQMDEVKIGIDSYFGFSSYDDPPGYRYRIGGFDEGRWITYEEAELVKKFEVPNEKLTGSGLYKNEADASLAVRACSGATVLTTESKNNSGPLKEAVKLGGNIIYLQDLNYEYQSLRSFILSEIRV